MSRNHMWRRSLFLGFIVLLNFFENPSARRLELRPLKSLEMKDLENPRSVSSGIAGLAGFAIGLGKALTAVFIYDVITANITETEENQVTGNGVSFREVCFDTEGSEVYFDNKEQNVLQGPNADVTCIIYQAQN